MCFSGYFKGYFVRLKSQRRHHLPHTHDGLRSSQGALLKGRTLWGAQQCSVDSVLLIYTVLRWGPLIARLIHNQRPRGVSHRISAVPLKANWARGGCGRCQPERLVLLLHSCWLFISNKSWCHCGLPENHIQFWVSDQPLWNIKVSTYCSFEIWVKKIIQPYI